METVSEDFSYLLGVLAEATGLDHLRPDENGGCVLQFDDRITLYLVDVPAEGAVRLVCDLGIPREELTNEALYVAMLEANWLGAGTHGATLSLEPNTREVCLWRQAGKAELTPVTFLDLVSQFVDAAEAWSAIIHGNEPPGSPESLPGVPHDVRISV